MAGPGLPTNPGTSTTGHAAAHDAFHEILNALDTGIGSASTGDVLQFASGRFVQVSAITALPAGATLTVAKSGGVWPARPTSRADIVVQWKGADPSPAIVSSGTGGMHDNVDIRLITP